MLYQDLQGLANGELIEWTHHRYLRTIQGRKQLRAVEVTAAGELTSWNGFTEAAASYGVPDASLWACLIRDVSTEEAAARSPRALVSTRRFTDGFAALPTGCATRCKRKRKGLSRSVYSFGLFADRGEAFPRKQR